MPKITSIKKNKEISIDEAIEESNYDQVNLPDLNKEILSELPSNIKKAFAKKEKNITKISTMEESINAIAEKEKTLEIEENINISNLNLDEIVKLVMDTTVSREIKLVQGNIVYKLGNKESFETRVIKFKVKPSFDDLGHAIVLGGRSFYKKDFKELFDIFDEITNRALKSLNLEFEKIVQKQEQLSFFEETQTKLKVIGVSTNLYDSKSDEFIETIINVLISDTKDFAIKLDDKSALTKADIYLLYSKSEEICEKFLGINK